MNLDDEASRKRLRKIQMSTDRTTEMLNYLSAISRDVGELREEINTVRNEVNIFRTEVNVFRTETNARLDRIEREQQLQGRRLDRIEGLCCSRPAPTWASCKIVWRCWRVNKRKGPGPLHT